VHPGLDYLFEFGTWNKVAEIVRDMSLPSIICDSLTDARSLIEQQAFQLVLCDDELPDLQSANFVEGLVVCYRRYSGNCPFTPG